MQYQDTLEEKLEKENLEKENLEEENLEKENLEFDIFSLNRILNIY